MPVRLTEPAIADLAQIREYIGQDNPGAASRIAIQHAKLRLVFVEPSARGSGVGAALVGAAIERARAAGFRRLSLWTFSILEPSGRSGPRSIAPFRRATTAA